MNTARSQPLWPTRASRGSGCRYRNLRSWCDTADDCIARGCARAHAVGRICRRSTTQKCLVQPGNRPVAYGYGDRRGLPQPPSSRADASGDRDAFVQAKTERRPVVLGIPFDLQNTPWAGETSLASPVTRDHEHRTAARPPEDALDAALQTISTAKKVVVFAGLGAVEFGAGSACRALAQKVGGLLTTTLPARGLFHDDPYCIGITGSYSTEVGLEYLKEADLVIAVGASLAFHAGGGGQLWPNAKVLHVDIAPATISQGQHVASHHLHADAKLGVEGLVERLDTRNDGWRTAQMAERISATPADTHEFDVEDGLLDPREAVAAPGRELASILGDGEFLRPLRRFLCADAIQSPGEISYHQRVWCDRQRHLVCDGGRCGAPEFNCGAL